MFAKLDQPPPNTRSASGQWFSNAADWSLNRFPRHADTVKLTAPRVTFDASKRPSYYNGATEGSFINVDKDTVFEITEQSTVEIGLQKTAPVNCKIGAWGSFSKCSKQCNIGSQTRTRSNVQPTFGGFSPSDCCNRRRLVSSE